MLKIWMYQALRVFNHSGTWWTTAISATSAGGSSIAAGTRKTIVVWYDWLRGVRTTNSCATAAVAARMTKVVQPEVSSDNCESNGTVIATAAAATRKKYPAAFGASVGASRPTDSTSCAIGLGTALTPSPPVVSG